MREQVSTRTRNGKKPRGQGGDHKNSLTSHLQIYFNVKDQLHTSTVRDRGVKFGISSTTDQTSCYNFSLLGLVSNKKLG